MHVVNGAVERPEPLEAELRQPKDTTQHAAIVDALPAHAAAPSSTVLRRAPERTHASSSRRSYKITCRPGGRYSGGPWPLALQSSSERAETPRMRAASFLRTNR